MSWQAAGFEAILTCGLVLMVLNMANGPKLNGPYVPLAVGGYVIAWATMGGPYDGAAMNPARALGPDVAIGNLSTWWVYLIGPAIGAVVAVGVAYVLRGPAKAQEALAAMGTPLQGIEARGFLSTRADASRYRGRGGSSCASHLALGLYRSSSKRQNRSHSCQPPLQT
jgi:hypothetical protein